MSVFLYDDPEAALRVFEALVSLQKSYQAQLSFRAGIYPPRVQRILDTAESVGHVLKCSCEGVYFRSNKTDNCYVLTDEGRIFLDLLRKLKRASSQN